MSDWRKSLRPKTMGILLSVRVDKISSRDLGRLGDSYT
jgi:hypothetical protein